MNKLTRADLLSLERYAEQRDDFRRKVMAHKKPRRIALGDHITLCFEASRCSAYCSRDNKSARVNLFMNVPG